ncbi:two-component hybrid sensor and regulator [Minicystis rosea]|nr:two-component hybrid sensor and regulator [Minicystis rosea]
MKTILVVDDEYAVVEALRALLEDEGYAVDTAANGEEALAAIDGGSEADLVLLDVMMPRLDGRGVLRAIHAHPTRHALPVIMMSAAVDPLPPEELRHAVFMAKPFEMPRLLRTIERLLRQRERVTEPWD